MPRGLGGNFEEFCSVTYRLIKYTGECAGHSKRIPLASAAIRHTRTLPCLLRQNAGRDPLSFAALTLVAISDKKRCGETEVNAYCGVRQIKV